MSLTATNIGGRFLILSQGEAAKASPGWA